METIKKHCYFRELRHVSHLHLTCETLSMKINTALQFNALAQDNMSESIPGNLPEQKFNCFMSQLLLFQFHKLMIGRYPFQNKRSKGLPSYLPKLDFIENILKFNCYMSQALFFWFLKCTVVMFFIKIIISLKVFQTYIKVGIQIFESLLENVIKKKTVDLCQQNVYITKLKFKYFEIHFFVLLHP